jgi:hypothetical protein
MGWAVYRAEKSQPWPGTASLEVSLVWAGHPERNESLILDGNRVTGITPSLDPLSRIRGNPYTLLANSGLSFQGSKVTGTGFVLTKEAAQALIARDPRNKEVLSPYLNGEDVNSRWDCSASRWVINFHDFPIERAMTYPEIFSILDRDVRPVREQNNRKVYRDYWWQYAEKRPGMLRAIAGLDRVLVMTLHSKTGLPTWVANNQVFSHAIGVFATDQDTSLSVLSSALHFVWWTTKGESTLETRLRYTPTDGFETFPQPTFTEQMERAGDDLATFRRGVMERRRVGLTDLYNLVHDHKVRDEDIVRLREIHAENDEAVREAYALDERREPTIRQYEAKVASAPLPSWREIELGHGFHETRQGVRFTISARARADVLDKLLALNHYRYEHEVKQGLHSGKGHGASRKKGAGRTPSSAAPALDDGGLFPPEGTLF